MQTSHTQFDNTKPTATATGTIDAPITKVWKVLAPSADWGVWWPLYHQFEMPKDEVGGIRSFVSVVTGHAYKERLVQRDESTHTLVFELVDAHVAIPFAEKVSTVVRLETPAENRGVTRVTWSSYTELKDKSSAPANLDQVFTTQSQAYNSAIISLADYISRSEVLATVAMLLNDKVVEVQRALLQGINKEWQYDDYPIQPMPRMVRGLPFQESLGPAKLGSMLTRILELEFLQAQLKARKMEDLTEIDNNIKAYLALTGRTEDPALIALSKHMAVHWETDLEFCAQLLQGVEPLTITQVTDASRVPQELQNLKGQGKSVQELASEKRLFMLDYKELRGLEIKAPMYFYAPIALIYKEVQQDKTTRLNILGFQLEPNGKVYTPDMEQKRRYKLARIFLACADSQIHQFIHHLGLAHLSIEPITVAVHNVLPEGNPIRALLEPHFRETIGINFLARQTLVAKKNAFTDETFSIGTQQGLVVVSNAWKNYDFFRNSFPEELKARGFDRERTDGLEDYHYRDDGFLIWDAIGSYTSDIVNHFYNGDQALASDEVIQKWSHEVVHNAKIPGFPEKITTRDQLSHILQIIIWNASCLHSILNYPQWNHLGITPNRPNALFAPMPEDNGKDIGEEDIKKSLPALDKVKFQILFSWFLSMPSTENLSDIKSMNALYPEADKRLHERFAEVTKTIEARNQKLEAAGRAPYLFLLPERVATSVNI